MLRSTLPPLLALGLLAALTTARAPQQDGTSDAPLATLELTYLANEGFLVRADDTAVVIDAFVREPYAGYPGLPATLAEKLDAADVPFDDVALALVSHVHGDHFQAGAALPFLEASSQTLLATSPQVLEALIELEGVEAVDAQLREVLPAAGRPEQLEHAGLEITYHRVAHGGNYGAGIQNLVHSVRLGGFHAVHLGDSVLRAAPFDALDLQDQAVDEAFVPYWFFLQEAGRELVREHIDARLYVAMHLPIEDDEDAVERIRSLELEVHVPTEPLAAFVLPAAQ